MLVSNTVTDIEDAHFYQRVARISLQAVYRRRKFLAFLQEEEPNWHNIVRIPRHYIETHVELCPRQKAKRYKTSS